MFDACQRQIIFSSPDQFLYFLRSRHFGFLPAFLLHRAQQHQYRNFVLLQIFQPMTARPDNFNCPALMLMVEICIEGQQFCLSIIIYCIEKPEGNQISVLRLIQYKVFCPNLLWFVDLIDFNSGQALSRQPLIKNIFAIYYMFLVFLIFLKSPKIFN